MTTKTERFDISFRRTRVDKGGEEEEGMCALGSPSFKSTMSTSIEDAGINPWFSQPPPSYYLSLPESTEAKLEEDDDNQLSHISTRQDGSGSFGYPLTLAVSRREKERIKRPVCLPQMERGFDMPFPRAYAPALADRGISQDVFLKFIDGLNAAMIASPPLQVVGLIGVVIGFVPVDVCAIASGVIQVSAQIAIHVVAKTLTDRHMRESNERIFAPAGLRARLCKTPAMRALARVPWVVAPGRPCFVKRMVGCKAKPPPMPALSRGGPLIRAKPPIVDSTVSGSLTRRMKPYEDYSLPITFDVPPPAPPKNIIVKMSDFAVNRRRNEITKKAENATVRRQLLAGIPVTRKPTRSDKRIMKKLANGKEEEVRKAVAKGDKRESKSNEKILWLVIINEEDDRIIQGSERVDDSKDEVVFTVEEIEKARKECEEDPTNMKYSEK
ncbi:hypothetical protein SCHPADRAFT_935222 [Schizopora paradoxa]|uniref:Uncharacterized protein n=1 Tax=Schizopora paradoxa TaxID=27342 RepID=A0A0H2SCH5_9AGAM|nr:hypothetical protein SCHPADRAFT_935222 [Schizopora paradoxa]